MKLDRERREGKCDRCPFESPMPNGRLAHLTKMTDAEHPYLLCTPCYKRQANRERRTRQKERT